LYLEDEFVRWFCLLLPKTESSGQHGEGDDQEASAKDFAEEFHVSTTTAAWGAADPPLA
jgi:hypothetical protein